MSDFVKDKDVPDKNVGDTISRQAAISAAEKESQRDGAYGYIDTKSIIDMLEDLPSAQPAIIRCKDCKHYDGRPCGIVDWYNTTDDFCSKAERREEEDGKGEKNERTD